MEKGKIIFTPRSNAQETLYGCTELVCIHWSYGTSYTIIYMGGSKFRVLLSGSKIDYVSSDVKISHEQGIED